MFIGGDNEGVVYGGGTISQKYVAIAIERFEGAEEESKGEDSNPPAGRVGQGEKGKDLRK